MKKVEIIIKKMREMRRSNCVRIKFVLFFFNIFRFFLAFLGGRGEMGIKEGETGWEGKKCVC